MKYTVTISETYTYTREIDCPNEDVLQEVLHEDVPLLVDMTKHEIEKLRASGLHLKSEFSW